jgi:CheY-like chemotaxis protein
MSHELRTPLNSIIGFSELLHLGEVGPMSAKQTEFVGDILASGRHLLRLISDVLDLSKVEAGKMEFYPERVELKSILDEVTSVLHPVARDKSIDITAAVDAAIGDVHLDPARIKQVLYNFLSNALKFSPRETCVNVRVRREGNTAFRIEVADNGPGISPEDQRRLFIEFEQLHRGRSKIHGGTGLGLALTRRIVEAQGGAVGVESALGKGSVFWAVLPRKSSGRGSLPQPRRIAGATPDAPRVLVVEDDGFDQERIVGMLVGAGYAVDTTATFAQAMQACEQHDYAAITLDLLLPDASGLDVLRAVRDCPRSREVPIIVVSVVTEQVMGGFVVHDVLTKPLAPDALLCSLERAGVLPPGTGPVLVVDDDSSSARLMVETLEQLGFRAVVAGDGHQALEKAQQERPSAVVLDLLMPHLDGIGFLDRFRAEPIWSHIPVLVWTVKDISPAERSELLQRTEAVMLKDGRGTRNLLHTLKDHLPKGARKTTAAHEKN